MRTRTKRMQRDAFTLMELLVVIAIIASLMALTASAVSKYVGIQEESNTKSTLNKVQSQINNVWSKVKDQAYKEPIPSGIDSWIRTNLAGSDANATGRVRVIYVKLKMRQAFPMTFAEATKPAPLQPLQSYVHALANAGSAVYSGAPYESSACLLMALQRGVSGKGVSMDDLTAGGAMGLAGNLQYLTDAWKRPILFSRYPAGQLIPMNGANDPGDPQGYLQTSVWSGPYGKPFSQLLLQQLAPTSQSYKFAPMVASGGQLNWMKGWTPGGVANPGFDPITFTITTNQAALFSTP